MLNLYLRKVLNKFNNLYLSLSVPTLIKQLQNPVLCIFSLLLLAHASYLLQLLWSIVPFLPYQAQCILSWVMLRLSPAIRETERGGWWVMRGNACYCVGRGLCMVFQHEAGRVLALHRDGVSHVYWFRWFKEVWGIKILVSTHLEDPSMH